MTSNPNRNSQLFWGAALILVGVLLLLDRLYVIDFWDFIGNYWPLILVIIGAKMILFPREEQSETTIERQSPKEWKQSSDAYVASDYISENRFIGDIDIVIQSEDFKGGSASTFIGDLKVDLSNMKIQSGTRPLIISGFIGDTTLRLPAEIPYMIQANAAIGDLKIFDTKESGFALNKSFKSPDYDSATNRLNVRISFFIGDVTIL